MPPLGGNGTAWRHLRPEFGQPPQVLCRCREQEFVSRATWSSKPQPCHPQNAFEVSEEHFDLLSTMP